MELQVYDPTDARPLWRVAAFGRQTTPAGRPYWWDNRIRFPRDMAVVQATLEGRIVYRDAVQTQPVTAGSLMLFTFGEDSDYGLTEPLEQPYRCQWVNLQGAGLLEHVAAYRQRHGSVRNVGLDHPLMRELDELIRLADPGRATGATTMAAAVHRLILHLFEDAEMHRMQHLSPVEQAIEYILRQPHGPLSLEQIAAQFGCSREHLGRAFRDKVGHAPGAYLSKEKRQRAMRLLRETDLPLSAIARQAGFPSAHTLARQIRRATGHPPAVFRPRRAR